MLDYLPNELIIEILGRLPVDSLLRFTFVYNSWHSVITNPIWTQKTKKKILLMTIWNSISHSKTLVGISKGLAAAMVCYVYFDLYNLDYFSRKLQIYLWNLSIRKSITISMPYRPPNRYMFGLRFGAHPTIHEFKVVRLWSQAFVNRAVNWVAYGPCRVGGFQNLILEFNMGTETFSKIMLPPNVANRHASCLSVKLFRESLAVFFHEQMG
ncbi:hypothetical protein ACSBR2_012252 [Camellia fascicularis]